MFRWSPSKFIQTAPLGTALLTVPILFPLVMAALGTMGLWLRNSQAMANHQAEQFQEEILLHVEAHLEDYFARPVMALELTQQAVKSGQLDSQDLQALETHFWEQSQVFKQLNNIYWGNRRGESISIIRRTDDSQEVGRSTNQPGLKARFQLDKQGNAGALLQEYAYDPRQRPWYKTALSIQKMQWTEVYSWTNLPILGITLTQVQRDLQGEVLGVYAIDLTLDRIQQFLQTLPIAQVGQIMILDQSGLLIASSTQEAPFFQQGDELKRVDPKQSTDLITRGVTQSVALQLKPSMVRQQKLKLDLEGEKYLVHLEPWQDNFGLDWTILIVLPEDAFFGQTYQTTRNTTLLNAIAFVVAVGFSTLIARWIANQLHLKSLHIEQQKFALKSRSETLAVALKRLETTQSQLIESGKMAALGRLVAGVAHEINTPVGNAILAASTLESETQALKSKAALETGLDVSSSSNPTNELQLYLETAETCSSLIVESLDRAGNLVENFKSIAVNQHRLHPQPVNVKACAETVVRNLSSQLSASPHRVEIKGDDALRVESDCSAISQILTNLLLNSFSHAFSTEQLGIVQIEIDYRDDHLYLCYRDNGKGIPPENIDKVFEPFFTTSASAQNSGLGLHIAYNLVTQRLAGTMTVQSTVNQGTQFDIRFPASAL